MHCIEGLMWHVCSRNYEKAGVPGFFWGWGLVMISCTGWMVKRNLRMFMYLLRSDGWIII